MKKMLALLFSLFALEALANDQWPIIDEFVGEQSLCTAFPAGSYKFLRKDCSFFCDEWQYTLNVSCDADGAFLQYCQGDHVFDESLIDQRTWAEARGNLLRLKAKNVASYGKEFVLTDVKKDNDLLTVQYEVHDGTGKLQSGTWVLKKGTAIQHLFKRTESTLRPIRETRTETLTEQR